MNPIDPELRQALTGISGILVTPFDDRDEVAPHRLAGIIDRAVGAGVHILVSNGNTGEFYGLTTAEAERMIAQAREATQIDRDRMMVELKREVARLVVDTTAKVTGKVLTGDDQRRLSEEASREIAA